MQRFNDGAKECQYKSITRTQTQAQAPSTLKNVQFTQNIAFKNPLHATRGQERNEEKKEEEEKNYTFKNIK